MGAAFVVAGFAVAGLLSPLEASLFQARCCHCRFRLGIIDSRRAYGTAAGTDSSADLSVSLLFFLLDKWEPHV
jgi:hypothetical protein